MYALTKPQKLIYDMEKYAGGSIAALCGSVLVDRYYPPNEISNAIRKLYEINDAFHLRIVEDPEGPGQIENRSFEHEPEILHFETKAQLDAYALEYAAKPFLCSGPLVEFKIVYLKTQCGTLTKLHHLVSDGWTFALIATQFCKLLGGEVPEACSYLDYIQSEPAYLSSKRYQKDRSYYLGQFEICSEPTFLSDRNTSSYRTDRRSFTITASRTEALKTFVQENHTSLYMLFMAAFGCYFSRVKMNPEHFYLGTAVLNRTGLREQNTAGMFINTVPFLVSVPNGIRFSEFLSNISNDILTLLRHQKFNYQDVLATLREQHPSVGQLYDVLLSYQNAAIDSDFHAETTWYPCGMQDEALQIHIEDRDRAGELHIHYDYQTEKFTPVEIEQLHCHLMNLLADAVRCPEKQIQDLQMLPEEEIRRLTVEFNNSASPELPYRSMQQLFEDQVLRGPDRLAVAACDGSFTYDGLNRISNRIAHGLIHAGIQPQDMVAFSVPRNQYLFPVILGILKAGAVYIPIDPDFPRERIEYILKDSHAKYFLTMENINDLLLCDDESNPAVYAKPEDLCYCIYTSGSTGNPKGAMIRHSNVFNIVRPVSSNQVVAHISQNHLHRIVSTCTISFDFFVGESLIPLANGWQIILATERQSKIQGELRHLLLKTPADVLETTPTKIRLLTANASQTDYLRSLKMIVLGGEAVDADLIRDIQNLTDADIFNIYGPTETTLWSSNAVLSGPDAVSIGTPISNTQIYIVDKNIRLLPVGIIGELCIAGDGVGAGYLNRPDLTRERYIPNPFGPGLLYRTGDLAYWEENGTLSYIGRNDFQAKIKGQRIELGEIEKEISSIDGIQNTVVIIRKNKSGEQFLCAFYTGGPLQPQQFRNCLSKRLPRYMVPHFFVHMDALPLTGSGKISRTTLPEIDLEHIESKVSYVPPVTEEEKLLVETVQTTLHHFPIGLNDSFLDLSGDSLKAIELMSALDGQGYVLEIKSIFSCRTMEELAKTMKRKEASVESDAVLSNELPLNEAQLRVYLAQMQAPDTTAYNIPYLFETDALNPARLQYALDALVRRHDALRTKIELHDGKVVQVILPEACCRLQALTEVEAENFVRPFDLSQAPLLRVGYRNHRVYLDMHHIISDGGSMGILLHELNEFYMGRIIETPARPYREFSAHSYLNPSDEDYWLSAFAEESPALELHTDFKRGIHASHSGNACYLELSYEIHRKIEEACLTLGITPYVFYMSGFSLLLSKFSGSEDLCVGIPISGRPPEFLQTIGMFVNTNVIRSKPEGHKTVAEFLHEVHAVSLSAIEHQNYPFQDLTKKLGISATNRNPLFDVMFAYQSMAMTDVKLGDRQARLIPSPISYSKYDFTFTVMPRQDSIVLLVEYCTDLYREATIHRLTDSYQQILCQMLEPARKIQDICPVDAAEIELVTAGFNQTEALPIAGQNVAQMFECQATRRPEQIAVSACDRILTYSALNREANQIAHSLASHGVRIGDLVAFSLKRNSHLLPVMLGVLKAGAAYLPIDPDYPSDRIQYMLSSSNAAYFITAETLDQLLENHNGENLNLPISGDSPCYCIYTSGSTGKPKGVLLTHRNVLNFSAAAPSNQVITSILSRHLRRIVSTTTIGFDIFVTESLMPLLNGLEILLADEPQSKIQGELNQLLLRTPADILQTTPTKMRMLISDADRTEYLKNIKMIILGGEALEPDLVAILKSLTDAEIFNIYGPTETTVWASNARISDEEVTIGRPIANTQIYLLDRALRPVPIGVTGEICIAGSGVGLGYLNRPELTDEKFRPNPFGDGKLYRTGDLGYWKPDGSLIYVGRNDFQVKIRGLRIELGEIERVLSSVSGITNAVVVVRKDQNSRQLICAFYTGTAYSVPELRKQLEETLPQYMVPHSFTHLDALPMTPSGKINRKALPEINPDDMNTHTTYIAPVTPVQKTLCRILGVVLGRSQIGLDDDFFDLGGDSLKAIEYVSKAHCEGIYFELQTVFEHPTVRQLCEQQTPEQQTPAEEAQEDLSGLTKCLNSMDCRPAEKNSMGNLLLTGATGFLGAHILREYLEQESGDAYCLVRGRDLSDSRKRLEESLCYYFGSRFAAESRIHVICADLLKDRFGLEASVWADLAEKTDTVIHSAASVKHYGSYESFREINVLSTERVISFCKQANARLIHISTLSVSGEGFFDQSVSAADSGPVVFSEKSFFIHQKLDNVYIRSKFEAEKLVLQAILDGLPANIMRMGNLTNRSSDLRFQRNYDSNAFLKRLRAVLQLGCFPAEFRAMSVEFTPVDEAADAIVKLAQHFDSTQVMFHITNPFRIPIPEFLEGLGDCGFSIQLRKEEQFLQLLNAAAADTCDSSLLDAFIGDMDTNGRLRYGSNVQADSTLTVDRLNRIGFHWKPIDGAYVENYIRYFRDIGFLNTEQNRNHTSP